jgi:hypothetical protein
VNNTQLSKWWQSPSAQAALGRARFKKKEKLAQFLAAVKAKQDKLRLEVENWKDVK